MKRVHALVANRHRLMREMLMTTIADQSDIEIVCEVVKDEDLNEAIEQAQPDVLTLALEEPERLGHYDGNATDVATATDSSRYRTLRTV